MGEPLNNYQSVVDAVRAMIDPQLFSLSPSHITVSTVGVTNRIRSLAVDLPEVNLALSLHAPNQEIRLAIVPTGKAYPVQKLIRACRYWQEQTGRRIFFEYVVLGGGEFSWNFAAMAAACPLAATCPLAAISPTD